MIVKHAPPRLVMTRPGLHLFRMMHPNVMYHTNDTISNHQKPHTRPHGTLMSMSTAMLDREEEQQAILLTLDFKMEGDRGGRDGDQMKRSRVVVCFPEGVSDETLDAQKA